MTSPADGDDGDLTRKQRREQAREQRKELEAAEAASAKRRARLIQLGIVAAVVVVIVVVIALATGGSSKKGIITNKKQATSTVAEINSELGGIPQKATVLGDPQAPVTMQYFSDLECPYCKEFTLNVLPTLIKKWVKTGKVKLEYHSFETATREPEVFKTQQVAALAVGKQNKLWYFVELFYHEQGEEDSGYVTEGYLQKLAEQVPGLNLTQWTSDRNEPALSNQVEADKQLGNNQGVEGTPSVFVGKSGGTLEKVAVSYTEATPENEAIEKALKA